MKPSFVDQESYQDFRRLYAERIAPIVVFCGAGLSAPAGIPTWSALRRALEGELLRSAQTFPDGSPPRLRLQNEHAGICTEPDYWVAFQRLRKAMEQHPYEQAIRRALAPASTAAPPDVYLELWKLKLRGMVTLNLDRFAGRSLAAVDPTLYCSEFGGVQAGSYVHTLQQALHPFVANLHGIADEGPSWVLTHTEVHRLRESPGYRAFMNAIFSTTCVLFMGISVDDIAAGGLLSDLRQNGAIDTGKHYWFTARTDAGADTWAKQNGISPIRYSEEHALAHKHLFQDLRRFQSRDSEADPVLPPVDTHKVSIPSPEDLAQRGAEEIRTVLAAEARSILTSEPKATRLSRYSEFCHRYRRALHVSWFVHTSPPDNILFGNVIHEQLGQGAFGTVYSAESPEGEQIAIKLLKSEIRDDPTMLGSFRRGVRSMEILRSRNVQGMVPYLRAYELPPCVLMERVDGPNLEVAVRERLVTDPWLDGLRIACDVASTVHAAHLLPERVLHRDIRPANIMLKGRYVDECDWSVVVLDFDLSSHKGAEEKSIVDFAAGAALGYLAPEQLLRDERASTRSTSVDAYGLAMTTYFMFAGRAPRLGEAASGDWPRTIASAVSRHRRPEWKSAPARLTRLLANATKQDQTTRSDMSQFKLELDRVRHVTRDPGNVPWLDMWAEELLCRLTEDYEWSDNRSEGRLSTPGGLSLVLQSNEGSSNIVLRVEWTHSGTTDWKSVNQFVKEAHRQAKTELEKGSWHVKTARGNEHTVAVEATTTRLDAERSADALVAALQRLKHLFRSR